jgi:hypothetical protein
MTPNPLDSDGQFFFTLRYPRPQFRASKKGPVYWVQFEMTPEEWGWFVDANTTGMVIECAGQVASRGSLLKSGEGGSGS